MKAVYVLDEMPESCFECYFRGGGDYDPICCTPDFAGADVEEYDSSRPDWCPFREMPPRRNIPSEGTDPYIRGIAQGFNLCLRAIEGSEEDD